MCPRLPCFAESALTSPLPLLAFIQATGAAFLRIILLFGIFTPFGLCR